MKPGPFNLITDVPGLMVGNAQDDTIRSGTTVLLGERAMTASYAVMGGAPGTRETDLLEPDKTVAQVDAVVLSGGSTFGLDAASGVVASLREMGRGLALRSLRIPLVPAAIIFDLYADKIPWTENPYPALGRRALAAAGDRFELGSVGAGTGALTGTLKGGLGSASVVLNNGITVGALIAANPVGSTNTPGDKHFWAGHFEIGSEFGGLGPDPRKDLGTDFVSKKMLAQEAMSNTAIAVVATDAGLTKGQAKRIATVAHDGIARAIVPSHLPNDGDLVFCVSTVAQQDMATDLDVRDIGHAAALCLSRAVARGVYHASPAEGDPLPCWSTLNR